MNFGDDNEAIDIHAVTAQMAGGSSCTGEAERYLDRYHACTGRKEAVTMAVRRYACGNLG